MADKKYYWLKLKKDFFKRHDIQVIRSFPNGAEYVLFYLQLLCESIDHEGRLRFSEEVPYTNEFLATITGTNIEIVNSALETFKNLCMIDILDDGTIFMKEATKMLGSETSWAEKKRKYREKLGQSEDTGGTQQGQQEDIERTMSSLEGTMSDKSKSKRQNQIESKSISNTLTQERNTYNNGYFDSPTLDEVVEFVETNKIKINPKKFWTYYTSNCWTSKGEPIRDWRAKAVGWEKYEKPKQSQQKEPKSLAEIEAEREALETIDPLMVQGLEEQFEYINNA